jgi:hypothetical protein
MELQHPEPMIIEFNLHTDFAGFHSIFLFLRYSAKSAGKYFFIDAEVSTNH